MLKMRKIAVWFLAGILLAAPGVSIAEVANPDVEGRIVKIEYTRSMITVSNVLVNKTGQGPREKRVKLKQGMINDYKLRDYVKVKLSADGRDAVGMEKVYFK
jgi:hypothetical protein